MNCSQAKKNINAFLRGTLKGNELRRTYYHLKKCDSCREVLLDEFSFYTTFNDLDKDLDFNYEKNLNEYMTKVEKSILSHDARLKRKYVIISLMICSILVLLLVIAIKVVYV